MSVCRKIETVVCQVVLELSHLVQGLQNAVNALHAKEVNASREPKANRKAKANREVKGSRVKPKDGSSEVTMTCHFGTWRRLQHLNGNVCKLLKSTICHSLFMLRILSSLVLSTPIIGYALHGRRLLCTCIYQVR